MNIQFPATATAIAYAFQGMEQKINEWVPYEWVRLCKSAFTPMPENYQTPLQIDFTNTSMVFNNAAGVMWALPILQTNALDRAKLIIAIAPTSDSVDKELKAVYETLANIEETVSRIGTQTREMAKAFGLSKGELCLEYEPFAKALRILRAPWSCCCPTKYFFQYLAHER